MPLLSIEKQVNGVYPEPVPHVLDANDPRRRGPMHRRRAAQFHMSLPAMQSV